MFDLRSRGVVVPAGAIEHIFSSGASIIPTRPMNYVYSRLAGCRRPTDRRRKIRKLIKPISSRDAVAARASAMMWVRAVVRARGRAG